ncbi:Hypothetical predicted protein [Mytilus galloprovincialis]|uniref:Mab-21-like HhH/H2TH-like domain-containing protein n=1 Tax=Mytilus galloprovincialis TaxID=29158 RepID=A0A8B6GCK8_MYTGA|nr:Hypothetical predicted protein [Mytilus galloprovincialis]
MNRNSRNQDNSEEVNSYGIKKTTYWKIYGVKRFPYRGKRLLQCFESDPREEYLYEQLVTTVGTEIDIRKRQRLFIIKDMIFNAYQPNYTRIASGSLAEGLNLPGSDVDIMYVNNHYDVIRSVSNIKHPIHRRTLVMETDIDHPGFTKLRFRAVEVNAHCRCHPGICTGKRLYLSRTKFLDEYKNLTYTSPLSMHGPCLSNQTNSVDIAFCLRCKYLPQNALPWGFRRRLQWPPDCVIDSIIQYGCLLVPIGPKTKPDDHLLWRLSFSVAEKKLVHSFNFTQFLCYGLLKLMLKRIVNTHDVVKDLLCSYFLKTSLFWISEEVDIETFQLSKVYYCFTLCLDKIISWVTTCYCPNYFIPEHNMFLGKINHRNNKILLCVLESIKSGGITGLTNNIFAPNKENHCLSRTYNESSFILLDFLVYRVIDLPGSMTTFSIGITKYLKGLVLADSLLKSETSTFIINFCKYLIASISKYIAQRLPTPNTRGETNSIRKCYHKLIQKSIKSDAVSGWLLYASYYYVTRQYNATLKLTDYILSKCSPDMIFLNTIVKTDSVITFYKHNVHTSMTLNEKMTIFTVDNVNYLYNSSLIPEELQLEVENHKIDIPPVFMSYCLRFLCYHHLGDISNRRQALRDLYLTVNNGQFITPTSHSDSLTILGVCNEISGYKDAAYDCYVKSLEVFKSKCRTAEIRKLKLFDI